ncbi:hypothetical protein K2X30_07310 [bacterium]|nr:hypothetical protein [bacterium]
MKQLRTLYLLSLFLLPSSAAAEVSPSTNCIPDYAKVPGSPKPARHVPIGSSHLAEAGWEPGNHGGKVRRFRRKPSRSKNPNLRWKPWGDFSALTDKMGDIRWGARLPRNIRKHFTFQTFDEQMKPVEVDSGKLFYVSAPDVDEVIGGVVSFEKKTSGSRSHN